MIALAKTLAETGSSRRQISKHATIKLSSQAQAEIQVTPGLVTPFEVIDGDGDVGGDDLWIACTIWIDIAQRAGHRLIEERHEALLLYGVPAHVFDDCNPVAVWTRAVQWYAETAVCDPFDITIALYRHFGWCSQSIEEICR